jgi:hypothetical protein
MAGQALKIAGLYPRSQAHQADTAAIVPNGASRTGPGRVGAM